MDFFNPLGTAACGYCSDGNSRNYQGAKSKSLSSALYYVRTQDLIVGTSIAVDNYASGKIYPLEVKVLRRERVKVPAGVFDCIVVKPILKSTGIFQQKGSLKVWLTDDRRRMPVLMKSEIVIGSIVAELTDYKGVVTD
ncbi:hypothetical protein B5M50_04005 [candidate division KSB1 bacterium 4484_219]|nr:MAG: hypothetical protein B5M50_04005 [candidate division KSB1 bacterium 4484_219]